MTVVRDLSEVVLVLELFNCTNRLLNSTNILVLFLTILFLYDRYTVAVMHQFFCLENYFALFSID